MKVCLNLWNKVCGIFWLRYDAPDRAQETISDEIVLQQAQQELKQAHNLFDNLNEPDMLDYAIYKMKAAEKHYDYLLKRVKNKG